MHRFVRCLITEWRRLKLPVAGETVIVAVSGGADSVSLLLALHDLKQRGKIGHRIVAAHFNHRLRGAESDADEEFVRQLTTKLRVELAVGQANIPTDGNLEQNARNARYDFLCGTAEKLNAFAVVTGHTLNDQAETFLMNLIRGSGPDGLRGMSSVRPLCMETAVESETKTVDPEAPLLFDSLSTLLVRPLLTWAKRKNTEGFCVDSGVEYRYDTMNEDTAFRRVRIRKILLPLLEDFNPKIIDTLAQTASLMQNSIPPRPENAASSENGLAVKDLKQLEKRDHYDTIRNWLRRQRGSTRALEMKHIEAVARLISSEKSGKTAELPGGDKVIKSGGKLQYVQNKVEN